MDAAKRLADEPRKSPLRPSAALALALLTVVSAEPEFVRSGIPLPAGTAYQASIPPGPPLRERHDVPAGCALRTGVDPDDPRFAFGAEVRNLTSTS